MSRLRRNRNKIIQAALNRGRRLVRHRSQTNRTMSRTRRSNQLRRQRNSKTRSAPKANTIRTNHLMRVAKSNLRASRRRRRMMTQRAPGGRSGHNPRNQLTNNRRQAALLRRTRQTRGLNSETRLQKVRNMRRRKHKHRTHHKQRRRTNARRIIPLQTLLRGRNRTRTGSRRRSHSSRNMLRHRPGQKPRRFILRRLSRIIQRIRTTITARRTPAETNRSSR